MPIENPAPKTPHRSNPDSVKVSINEKPEAMSSQAPTGPDSHPELIRKYAEAHRLTDQEAGRLHSVLVRFEPHRHEFELAQELNLILNARILHTTSPLSRETILRARDRVEAGLTPFELQEVD